MKTAYAKSFAAAMLLLAALPLPASAQQAGYGDGFKKGGVSLLYGNIARNNRIAVNYETPPLWSLDLGATRLELTGEVGVAYWWTQARPSPGFASGMWQLNAIPMFRWWLARRFYIEGGVGATLVSEHLFGRRDISSTFQFGDHLGFGYLLTPESRIGVRLSHFSNAGMEEPNQGLNQVQILYAQAF